MQRYVPGRHASPRERPPEACATPLTVYRSRVRTFRNTHGDIFGHCAKTALTASLIGQPASLAVLGFQEDETDEESVKKLTGVCLLSPYDLKGSANHPAVALQLRKI